ncbi:histidine phosphatase family protein [Ligilactobacillus apodemi]|uniref:Phosphoglycerate mutase n=1 Tax=Ligilactobacillus apodemi DSM 16634 = JCM 16172 TaxID=1423724 RepID=A0A0R1U2S0_9LACO|nr:histidine phosphatase family protein [Ligilactobacillus apodemi]KRL87230.1 phosphoglycerate mutase [Ligilactobacillus apodemi DSM 16634 = JCM 16172]MBD5068808.1 histidine phosphatase family protein [Lactobacillus sp.]MBD5069243.1 histidine phosphatase family protein [Lactobacillus sp.]MCR1901831.1 histidine phosphatase family protein [Ligilactobacillus apodemi]
MTNLYFVRHGKTQFNQAGKIQGAIMDSPLLPQSIADAKKTGKALATVDFAKVFSSPQKRALDTGKYIVEQFKKPVEIETLPALKEFNFGAWDGDLVSEHINDKLWQTFKTDPDNFDGSSFGAESYADLTERVENALAKIVSTYPNDNILLTAHALVITFAVKHLLGKDYRTIREEGLVANTSITVLETPDFKEFSLVKWNETKHLN